MCIYMCTCAYICIYACVYMDVYMRLCICIFMYICVCMYIYICVKDFEKTSRNGDLNSCHHIEHNELFTILTTYP